MTDRHEMSDEDAYQEYLEQARAEYKEARRFERPVDVVFPLEDGASVPELFSSEWTEQARQNIRAALGRVGESDESRARWLLRFAAADPSTLTAGQRLDLQWDVVAFMMPPPFNLARFEVGYPHHDGDIAVPLPALHAWVGNGIKGLEEGPRIYIEGSPNLPSWTVDTRRFCRFSRVGHQVIVDYYDGAQGTEGRFRAEAVRVLSSQARRFRFCGNCGRAFIATKRQAYCTASCSQSVRTKKYRAKKNLTPRPRRAGKLSRKHRSRSGKSKPPRERDIKKG